MKNIAIIPARSGSKGVKDKNIRELNGKPLIAYTIEAAINSGEFDEVMVSTDSIQYAEIAKRLGANVPFLRSKINASDTASSWDMVLEVLESYKKIGKEFDTFCLLQPTSPLRTSDDIINAYNLFRNRAQFSVVSVCEAEHSPFWCGLLPETLELDGFITKNDVDRRQSFKQYYRLNGAIYIVKVDVFDRTFFPYQKGCFAYIMPRNRSVDIDSEEDFIIAEAFLRKK